MQNAVEQNIAHVEVDMLICVLLSGGAGSRHHSAPDWPWAVGAGPNP